MSTCHAYSKLRMHTEATVETLRIWTATFMNNLRDLDKQLEALFDKNEKEKPYLNLNTVKFHSIADYPNCIMRFGSTDSYSTAIVSIRCKSTNLLLTLRREKQSTRKAKASSSAQTKSI